MNNEKKEELQARYRQSQMNLRRAKQLSIGHFDLSRRNFLKGMGTAAVAAGAGASLLGSKALAAKQMGYMCWEGYNAPVIVDPFEKAHDIKMNIDVIIDDTGAFAKLTSGAHRTTDVVTLDAPWIQRMGPAGLCEFLDYNDFKDSYDNFYPQFAHPFTPLLHEDKITGLPTRFGWIGIALNTKFQDPDKWHDFSPIFEPENKNKFAVCDFGDYPILALAQHVGINPYVELSKEELDEMRKLFRKVFEASRQLVGDLTLLQKGLIDGSLVTFVGCGNFCTSGARYSGHREVMSKVPEPLQNGFKRGAIWLEATAIVKEPDNPEEAKAWLKWVSGTDVGYTLSLNQITSNPVPNKRVEAKYTDDEKDILQFDYTWEAWDKSMFQTLLPNTQELLAMFQEELANAA